MSNSASHETPTPSQPADETRPDLRVVFDAIHAEQRSRWECGDRVPAEALLEAHPTLRSETSLVVDLLYHEYLLGHELGDGPELSDFVARFPEHGRDLVRQVCFGETLSGDRDSFAPIRLRVPERIGRFEVQGEIGRGRFGVVYSAADPLLSRQVAVKVARPEIASDPNFADRFLREAAAAAGLEHSGIVNVYEVGSDGESLFYVMELCEGSDLAKWLAERGSPLPAGLAADLVRQMAEAVESAHGKGLVHRDLKPANLMISPRPDDATGGSGNAGEGWRIRVLDFGLARSLQDELSDTRSSMMLGTPLYMAPEMAGRGRGDARSDVFSIGAILYELLTGRPPFDAETVPAVLKQLRVCEAIPPRRLRPEVDRDLETICLRCLRRDPDDRYQSAGDVAVDLQRHRAGEALRGRRVGWRDRLSSWSRHGDRVQGFGMAICVISLLLVIWTLTVATFASTAADADDAMSADEVLHSWFFVLAVVVPPHFLVGLIGWRAARGGTSPGLLVAGTLVVAVLAVYALLTMMSLVPAGIPWYDTHPLAKQFVFMGLVLALSAETAAFVVLLRAHAAR